MAFACTRHAFWRHGLERIDVFGMDFPQGGSLSTLDTSIDPHIGIYRDLFKQTRVGIFKVSELERIEIQLKATGTPAKNLTPPPNAI